MFSFPYSDSHFYPQSAYSYGPTRPRSYAQGNPYAYARAVAEERAAREAAARRAAAEQEYDVYGFPYGYSPRERAYLEAQRKQEAMQKERARLIALEERRRREANDPFQNLFRSMRRSPVEQEPVSNNNNRVSSIRTCSDGSALKESEYDTASSSSDPLGFFKGFSPRAARTARSSNTHRSPSREPTPTQTSLEQVTESNPLPPVETTPLPTEANTSTPDSEPASNTLSPTQDQLEAAATKIQSFYRSQKALTTISKLEGKFRQLKQAFAIPNAIDFISEDGTVITLKADGTETNSNIIRHSVPAKLAFTSTNVPIRAYDEELNRILTALDAVESWGDKKVREKRKDTVRMVEDEAARVEGEWAAVWKAFSEKSEEEKVIAVLVDDTPVHESAEMAIDELHHAAEINTSELAVGSDGDAILPAQTDSSAGADEVAVSTPSISVDDELQFYPTPSVQSQPQSIEGEDALSAEIKSTPLPTTEEHILHDVSPSELQPTLDIAVSECDSDAAKSTVHSNTIQTSTEGHPDSSPVSLHDAIERSTAQSTQASTSSSEYDMESQDSDYQSVGSFSEDERDDGSDDESISFHEDADFVML